jgi:alcohol dehydrogenase (cytochrome c)
VVGIAGGDHAIRCFLAAYDVSTGEQLWKFETIPAPGEIEHESWENDAWRTGGGATWNTGSYDPSTDLLYWGVGNPAPQYSGDGRPGDNLFTNSVIALHARTGRLAWYFQFSRTTNTTGIRPRPRFLRGCDQRGSPQDDLLAKEEWVLLCP